MPRIPIVVLLTALVLPTGAQADVTVTAVEDLRAVLTPGVDVTDARALRWGGGTFVQARQTWNDLPVYGGRLVADYDSRETLRTVRGAALVTPPSSSTASVSVDEAINYARGLVDGMLGTGETWPPITTLGVLARNGRGTLVQVVDLSTAEPVGAWRVFVDASTGEEVWSTEVDGKARSLAAASGGLFVSTDKGAIHCFGTGPRTARGTVDQPIRSSPYQRGIYRTAARTIIEETGVERGYCLVLGCETGRLASELAALTELTIYVVEPDATEVEAARKALDAVGLYGVRVCVEQCALSNVPYSDYFANLIVSESALISGEPPGDAGETFRMLKPMGGVAYLGQPAQAAHNTNGLTASRLRRWLSASGADDWRLVKKAGLWAKVVRGPLPGAGRWTHQYAEPGNTSCSDDRLVKYPLGVLWFGGPGPAKMPNRHENWAAPLSVNGRLFIEGDDLVTAYDAYNGLKLWERQIPGALRVHMFHECGNLAANEDGLFVAAKSECLHLDAATGRTRAVHRAPPPASRKSAQWGYVATVGDLVFGSRTEKGLASDCVFAVDLRTGQRRWVYHGGRIHHNTIAIGGGRLYLSDRDVTPHQRERALKARREELKGLKGRELLQAQNDLKWADVRLVVAIDIATGKKLWARAYDLTNCGGRIPNIQVPYLPYDEWDTLMAMYRDERLVICGSPWSRRVFSHVARGDNPRWCAVTLAAADGRVLWSRPLHHRMRPLIVGDTLFAQPWAFDLRTGEQKMRTDPATGERTRWCLPRGGHGCGAMSACPAALFFRSWSIAYHDLAGGHGTTHFGAQCPGCWVNTIPANGLVMVPEASTGCMCGFPITGTIVLRPK